MCDVCQQGKPCINMCCPHGHAYVSNPDFIFDYNDPDYDPDIPPKICKKSDDADGYNPQFWNHTGREEIEFTRHEDYILTAHNFDNGIGFSCPSKNIILTPSPADMAEKVNLKINGDLEFKGLPNYVDGELKGKKDKTYDSGNYCIVYTQPPDYSDYDENNTEATTDEVDFQFTHMVCSEKTSTTIEKTVLSTTDIIGATIETLISLLQEKISEVLDRMPINITETNSLDSFKNKLETWIRENV
jgi:hypothetical protein